jgi:ligand-binding sensor domain-containing protein
MLSFKRQFIVTLIILTIQIFLITVILSNSAVAQNNSSPKKSEPSKTEPKKPEPPKPEPKVQRIAGLNAKFIFAIISDGGNGAWIGTEDEGVFHYNANGKITQYTTKNGLGDNNAYALAIDKLGRLWVGHLNKGVSVFNGKDWKNYDVVDGPIGERIFDIKVCPKDGDVWLATSAGLSRYKIDANKWEHLTREDGLLEDQASTLAFKSDGTLIVGTQCHGLAIFNRNARGEYKHSKNIVAPNRFGPNNCSPVPLTPMGAGLPSNLINDILVTKNSDVETIWIATNAGLVKANDSLKQLEYWRGKDYANKVRGLYGGAPKDWKEAPKEITNQLLSEDYLTCLDEDDQGVVWIGTRQNGTIVADPKTGKKSLGNPKAMGYPDNFVTKILNLDGGDYLIGFDGGGVVKSIKPYQLVDRKPAKTKFNKAKIFSVAQNDFPKMPLEIKPPTIEELKAMQVKLDKLKKPLPKNYAEYYGEDWKTQGDWCGHYGRIHAILCGTSAPMDHCYFRPIFFGDIRSFIGPHSRPNDTLRRWVHWLQTDNPKTLYSPTDGYRRQAEWDDHGEAYPWYNDGPDIWYYFRAEKEAGIFNLGMYFFNKDGHEHGNRCRDYIIEVYSTQVKWKDWEINPLRESKEFAKLGEKMTRESKLLCRTRVRDFWGGVHKSFSVKAPGLYMIKIDRNYSLNTIVSSVTIDRLTGTGKRIEKIGLPIPMEIEYSPLPIPEEFISPLSQEAANVWNRFESANEKTNGQITYKPMRIAVLRAALSAAPKDMPIEHYDVTLAESLRWRLKQWNPKMRKEFQEAITEGRKRYAEKYPDVVKRQEEQLRKRKDGTWKYPLEGVTSE